MSGLAFVATDIQADTSLKVQFGESLKKTAQQTGHLDGDKPAFFGSDKPVEIVGKIIQFLLSFLGVLFLVLLIYGGYLWMMDRGEEALAKKAKDIIKNAIIGLIIVLGAYAITNFVMNNIFLETYMISDD